MKKTPKTPVKPATESNIAWMKDFWENLNAGKLCQSCGACCGPETFNEVWAGPLNPTDFENLKPRYRKLNVITDGDGDHMIKTHWTDNGQVCVSLLGEVGKKVACGIYDRRPNACRVYQAGDDRCCAARKRAGIPTPGPVIASI